MKLRECKVGLPVRVRSVYHSHPLDGFIYKIIELRTTYWDHAIPTKNIVVYVMLTDGSRTAIHSMSHLKLLKRNGHETT